MAERTTPRGERLRIRPATYRGVGGFKVFGYGTNSWPTSIFVETKAAAEHIRRKLYAGLEPTVEDFSYGEDGSIPIRCSCGGQHVQIGAGL